MFIPYRAWPQLTAMTVLLGVSACRQGGLPPDDYVRAEPLPGPVAPATDPAPGAATEEISPEVATKPAVEDEPPLPPPPAEPILDDPLVRDARVFAQRRLLGDKKPLQPDLRPAPEGALPGPEQPIGPEELPGFFAPLEYPTGVDPLRHFERSLRALEAGERHEPVRVALYGASGTVADLWTAYVRAYLQRRFGDAGPGIVQGAKPNKWYRHHELVVDSSKKGWTKHNSYHLDGEEDPGQFGIMGQAMSSDSDRAWAEVIPRSKAPSATELSYYEVHYLQQADGGSFEVRIDGQLKKTVRTKARKGEEGTLGRARLRLSPGKRHRLRIDVVGDGNVRLLGVVAEIERPGVVVDTLGVNGAKITNQLAWDVALWAEHLHTREPQLVAFAFGANEASDDDLSIPWFEAKYREILDRFRAELPEASCLIMAPGEMPVKDEDGELMPRPVLDEVREVEHRVAMDYGCAYFDARILLGGQGAKATWVEAGLAKDDMVHLNRAGYTRLAMGLTDALMQRYDWRDKLAAEAAARGQAD